MQSTKTYTKRTNARRAAIQEGVPADSVEITVHKKDGEVRFGWKRAEQSGKPKPGVTTPVSAPMEERRGVKRPREGGVCRAVWDALDQMRAGGVRPTSREVRDLAVAKRWNQTNAICELSRWRKFNGIARTS